jgi:hypothetical protein
VAINRRLVTVGLRFDSGFQPATRWAIISAIAAIPI